MFIPQSLLNCGKRTVVVNLKKLNFPHKKLELITELEEVPIKDIELEQSLNF